MSEFHIITFGCQMNKSDSERISALFIQKNHHEVELPEQADFVVINACSVRQTAIHRIWGVLANFSERNRKPKFILTGCLLPEDKQKLAQHFDLVFDIKNLFELDLYLGSQSSVLNGDYFKIKPKQTNHFQAFVPIMTGCNNYCAYCVVPYVRGGEVSRSVKEVLAEVNDLAKSGVKEIQLLGQNVNSYRPADPESFSEENIYQHPFAKLLFEVNKIPSIERILFVASHPKDMDSDVIHALTLPKMVNYIHLALQSGDDDILRAMNRKYTVRDYYQIIKKIRRIKPRIAIGTDIIVGYPGESTVQFENTLKFYNKVKFDISFNAMFSPRDGTAATKLVDDVPHAEKKRRWHALQDLMEKIVLEKNKKFVAKEVQVLIDIVNADFAEGNSLEMKRVRLAPAGHQPGDIVRVVVKEAKEWLLLA